MVGPCRRDSTALVEQESKGGASETVGSSEMSGRLWACSSRAFLAAMSPPWHNGRVEQPHTKFSEFSQEITTSFIQDSNLCM